MDQSVFWFQEHLGSATRPVWLELGELMDPAFSQALARMLEFLTRYPNITGKPYPNQLELLFLACSIPELFIDSTADLHTVTDADTYKEWLDGYLSFLVPSGETTELKKIRDHALLEVFKERVFSPISTSPFGDSGSSGIPSSLAE